jgi:hypothetical protein
MYYKEFQIVVQLDCDESLIIYYPENEVEALQLIRKHTESGDVIRSAYKMHIEKVFQTDGFKFV